MASHEHFQDLISLYALGALTGAERRELQAHLRECGECRARLREDQAVTHLLAKTVDEVEPSQETKLKLFARVDADLASTARKVAQTESGTIIASRADGALRDEPRGTGRRADARPAERRSWFGQWGWALAGLSAVLVVMVGAWIALGGNTSPEQRTIASILNDPAVKMVALAGTKDAPGAQAEMYMVPGHSQAVLKVSGLEPLPGDKGYEFWFFKGQDPQPSDVFTVSAGGDATVIVRAQDRVENYNAWGVTIEPRAGVARPTGPIVLLGGG